MDGLPVTVAGTPLGNGSTDFAAVGKLGHMLLDICGKLGHLDQSVAVSIAWYRASMSAVVKTP